MWSSSSIFNTATGADNPSTTSWVVPDPTATCTTLSCVAMVVGASSDVSVPPKCSVVSTVPGVVPDVPYPWDPGFRPVPGRNRKGVSHLDLTVTRRVRARLGLCHHDSTTVTALAHLLTTEEISPRPNAGCDGC